MRFGGFPGKRTDPHTLAGAYAMDALEAADAKRFERHLAGCDACAQEVSELRETASRLGTATAVPPPPGMRAAVLAAAARTSQQHVPAVAGQPARAPAWAGGRGGGRFALVTAPVTAGLVAVAVVFGMANSDANQRLDQDGQRNQAVAAVLTARDAHMMTGVVTGGGSATIVMSHHMDALVFTAANLPASSGYELWLVGPDGQRAEGTVAVAGHGMAGPVIAAGLHAGDHLMLTAGAAGSTVLDIRL
jgi:anti-sigma factor RsiW